MNEDNFLDELSPLLRQPCPDPETASVETLAAHAERCPACADLRQRLQRFEAAHEAEWKTAERRLDQWLANLQPAPAKPKWRWRFEWLLIPALAAASIAAIVFLRHPTPAPQPAVAVYTPPAKPPEEPVTLPPAQPAEAPVALSGGTSLSGAADLVTSPLPETVRVNAGARLWIFLKSLDKKPDATFEFRGVVMLPVTQNGAVVIDRETEVSGTGRETHGKPLVQIHQFGSHGSRYRLTRSRPAPGESGPGSSGDLPFDAGQVLEMSLASVSTYERVP